MFLILKKKIWELESYLVVDTENLTAHVILFSLLKSAFRK